MKNAINKIFSNENDLELHYEFIKFGKGYYEDKYLIEGTKQKSFWFIKASNEFANFLVLKLLSKAPEKIKVSGAIITTLDLKDKINFDIEKIKNYAGIKEYMIDTILNKADLINLIKKYPRAFYALSFSLNGSELRIKTKPPMSSKQGSKVKGKDSKKADFCSLKTNDKEVVEDLFFDVPDFCSLKTNDKEIVKDLFFDVHNIQKIEIRHNILINGIEIPKDAKTPEEMRERAIRKGKIIRLIKLDGKNIVREKDFKI